MKKKHYKWLIFALCGIALFASGATARSSAVSEREVVTGLAIDAVDDGGVEVTAEVISPDNMGGRQVATVTAKSATVAGALSDICRTTGKKAVLTHCDMILLGAGIIRRDAFGALDHLIRNAYVSENAMLATTDGRASDLLSATVDFAETPALYAKRMLVSYAQHKGVTRRTVKDFMITHLTPFASNRLAVIKKTDTEEEKSVFTLGETAVFSADGRYLLTLSEAQSEGLDYFLGTVKKGDIATTGDGGESINLEIINKNCGRAYDLATRAVTLDVTLTLAVREIYGGGRLTAYGSSLSKTETDRIRSGVAVAVADAFEACKAQGADVFDLYGGFFRRYGRVWRDTAGVDYLQTLRLNVNVKLILR